MIESMQTDAHFPLVATDWDEHENCDQVIWPSLESMDMRIVGGEWIRHDLHESGKLPLATLAIRRSGSRKLVVALHGTLNRATTRLPRFERARSLSTLDANVLILADTTLTVEKSLPTAWFIGTPEDAITDRYAQLIHSVIDQWGIEHTVIAGASSGGFAALALAPRVPEALAVAMSPQTRIRNRPTSRPFQQFVYNRFGGWDGIEKRPELRPRVDLTELYHQLPAGNAWYIQNTGDVEHVEQHANPFLTEHEDRVKYVQEYHCEGHNPPTPRRFLEWVQHGLDLPLSDPRESVTSVPTQIG